MAIKFTKNKIIRRWENPLRGNIQNISNSVRSHEQSIFKQEK